MRFIAAASKEGVRLTEVASELRFKIPTARRLLQALLKEELVLFNSENKTYHVGVGLISLGAVAASSPALAERYMPALFAIANATKDTVSISCRMSCWYTLCSTACSSMAESRCW